MLEREPSLGASDFYVACACGELKFVEQALRDQPELARREGGVNGWQPLVYACFSRFWRRGGGRAEQLLEIVRSLLGHGADPNSHYLEEHDRKAVPQTCLFAAAGIANSAPLTELLLSAGADVDEDVRSEHGPAAEALYHASEFADVACLQLLLEARPEASTVTYCLSRALDFDNEAAALLFLRHGADARHVVPWHQRRSHLHKAVMNGRSASVIRALLAGGADPNLPDAQGLTPYRLAVRCRASALVSILEESGAEPSTLTPEDRAGVPLPDQLIRAARRDDVAELERLVAAGGDIHAALDVTPLHGACYAGQLEAARWLLERGASLTSKNRYGGDALGACIYGSTDCHDVEGGPSARLPEEVPARGYAALTELLIARGATLPASVWGGSEAVQKVLRRHGVPD